MNTSKIFSKKILRIDPVHPLLDSLLRTNGWTVDEDLNGDYKHIAEKIASYQGLILRSRIPVDKFLIDRAKQLKFIARVGSGTEGIDKTYAAFKNIVVINAPEGNRNAVAEHALWLLLGLIRKSFAFAMDVKNGNWNRNAFLGNELEGKVVGIIGYGNTGQAFAEKLSVFGCEVICHDIIPGKGDRFARQTHPEEIFQRADIISLHVPLTPKTHHMVNARFVEKMKKNFYLINTARGETVETESLLHFLDKGKILGAALDVIEYEHHSFNEGLKQGNFPDTLQRLLNRPNIIITPHIAGLSEESARKLAKITADKILNLKF